MEIERYIKLVESTKKSEETIISMLKKEGASEGEATFALMKGLDISLNDARRKIKASNLWESNNELNDSILEAFNE